MVMASWNSELFIQGAAAAQLEVRAAKINKFYKHVVTINNEVKIHLLAYLSWFKVHPKNDLFGKPVSVWYYDLYDYCGFVPVQYITSRSLALMDSLDGESVFFVVPCVE